MSSDQPDQSSSADGFVLIMAITGDLIAITAVLALCYNHFF
jgi:hypothetical protein